MNILSFLITSKKLDETTRSLIESLDYNIPKFLVLTEQKSKINIKKTNVLFYQFKNDYASLKNFGLNKVRSEWVFVLDSDEKISDELLSEVRRAISISDIDGFWIPRKTFISENKYLKYGLFFPDYQMRLFKNKQNYRYVGKIHEQLSIPLDKTSYLKNPIIHHPRNPKYTKWSDYINLVPYIMIERKKNKSIPLFKRFFLGLYKSITLFLTGFLRGKGFLDGYPGFRAHVLFSWSVFRSYI